jgi:IMP dehydrogenase
MEEFLSYDDVLLKPRYSDIRSRAEVSIATQLGNGLDLNFPIIASPMDTISEVAMATALGIAGGTAVIHRYNTPEMEARNVSMAIDLAHVRGTKNITVGAAIGVTGDYLLRAQKVLAAGASFLCVDVAHGHHIMMKEALTILRKEFGSDLHIMAGNVATLEGVNDLADWGATSVRCNIGGGSICSTRVQTGHGVPGLHTLFECAKTDRAVTLIADGGIRNSGDIVKALAAGADAIMCGSLFSGTDETPGKVIEENDGTRWKVYRGMASKEAQMGWRGKYSSDEGVSARVPYRGTVKSILEDLQNGIKSGLSYSGARTVSELTARAEFIRQTNSGLSESGTHIRSRAW